MTITEAEAQQLEILANSLLRLIADWREQRKKNESAADAYHAGYRAAQELVRMTAELDDIRKSGLSPEEATRP